jgi:XkdW protein
MILSNALKQLFPAADPLRDYVVQDDGVGVYIAAWRLPDPQPTPAQLQAASDAYDVTLAQAASDASALRTQVVNVAQSAVGVLLTNLTAAQVRALLAVLLWKGGALDKDGKVRPLNEWGV